PLAILLAARFGISPASSAPTVTAAPALACFNTWPLPPVALKSACVPPRASANVPEVITFASNDGADAVQMPTLDTTIRLSAGIAGRLDCRQTAAPGVASTHTHS